MSNRPIDITGKRVGKLVAVKRTDVKYKKSYLWVVRCDCGNEKLMTASKFNSGIYKSCGCSRNAKPCLKVAYQGKRYTVKELAEVIGVEASIIYRKLNQGFCASDIANGITTMHKDYGLARPTTIVEMAKAAGITKQAMRSRIKSGWRGYKLLSPRKGNGRCPKANANCVENS